MDFGQQLTVVAALNVAALASPGPDFLMASRNALAHGRKAGVATAAGFASGEILHASYCGFGLAAIIVKSLLLFTILKLIGAAYLIFIGVKALRSRGGTADLRLTSADAQAKTLFSAFRDGFLTNLLNPKAILFFFALFTVVVRSDTSPLQLVAYGATSVILTFLWFSMVALLLSRPAIRQRFLRSTSVLDKICGGLFILFGILLVL